MHLYLKLNPFSNNPTHQYTLSITVIYKGLLIGHGRKSHISLGSLSSDVFEQCTSTGNGLFAHLSSDFEQIFGQIVSLGIKTLGNTNMVASRLTKREKGLLPVDVRHSKTLLLKLPNSDALFITYQKYLINTSSHIVWSSLVLASISTYKSSRLISIHFLKKISWENLIKDQRLISL